MESVVLVIHLILALGIIVLVLLQRSEGGGLGIGGGGGGLGAFASARGTANALTKLTALFATGFFCTSLILGVLASNTSRQHHGLLEGMESSVSAPADTEQEEEEGAPIAIQFNGDVEMPTTNESTTEESPKPDAPAAEVEETPEAEPVKAPTE